MSASSTDYSAKAEIFKSLHTSPGIFVIPNPWDAGSAKILMTLGFKALATTSAGVAFSLGKPDGADAITREDVLSNAALINAATDLPVSADLENGYGDSPGACAETVLKAAETGLAGCSIEDATNDASNPIYTFGLAVERVKAAVSAARSLGRPFMLTARAENLIHGRPDLQDTIKRLVAFADAGADVLYAPGLKTKEEIAAVVKAVSPKPVNVLMGLAGVSITVTELEDLGVKRISVGSSLTRAAYSAFLNGAKEIAEKGTFGFADGATPYSTFNSIFS
jgi:2-methylisocitrate lyase-like PEP mutase family enzyme